MPREPDNTPLPPAAEDCDAADEDASSDARQALEKLMVEGRKLVIEMRRLLRAQRQRRLH
jgi:hypothetical protein